MTANPFGLHDFYNDSDTHRGDWTIPAYELRNFLYRVLIHRGSTAAGQVRERYHDFVNIPSVELVSTPAPSPEGAAEGAAEGVAGTAGEGPR